jgi:hypothetical protein
VAQEEAVFELHSPRDHYFSEDLEPMTLKEVIATANFMGLNMTERNIPDGLNKFEENNPTKAVIFDVRSEDVVMIEI